MGIWIRTQDRTGLIKASLLNYWDGTKYYKKEMQGHWITTSQYEEADESIFVGKYNSKERCLEVLDEIQEAINGRLLITEMTRSDLENDISHLYVQPSENLIRKIFSVYEMPKE